MRLLAARNQWNSDRTAQDPVNQGMTLHEGRKLANKSARNVQFLPLLVWYWFSVLRLPVLWGHSIYQACRPFGFLSS